MYVLDKFTVYFRSIVIIIIGPDAMGGVSNTELNKTRFYKNHKLLLVL